MENVAVMIFDNRCIYRFRRSIRDMYVLCTKKQKPLSGLVYRNNELVSELSEENFIVKVSEDRRDLYQITLFPGKSRNMQMMPKLFEIRIEFNFNVEEGEVRFITFDS